MKDILTRLFNHEELTSEETKQILLNITREAYPEAQISALLTVFQMRSITVDELIGFREALMETRVPTLATCQRRSYRFFNLLCWCGQTVCIGILQRK